MKFILWLVNFLSKPVIFDGFLAFTIGICNAAMAKLATDEAFKYVNGTLLFWLVFTFCLINGGAASLIFFRSKSYADHNAAKNTPTNTPTNNENKTNTNSTTSNNLVN